MTPRIRPFLRTIFAIACAAFFYPALGMDKYDEQLNKVLAEYRALPKTQDVKRLVELHLELSALVKEMSKAEISGARFWREGYQDFGLYIENWTDIGTLGYSGKLLEEAHKRNPNSPYRKYTLFTAIAKEPGYDGENGTGNFVKLAESYLREFPNGPYVANVYALLGWFYDDLGKTLRRIIERGVEEGMPKGVREYECFVPYITSEPYEKQMRRAFSLAAANLESAIAANPSSEQNKYRRQYLAIIKSGKSDTWTWCTSD